MKRSSSPANRRTRWWWRACIANWSRNCCPCNGISRNWICRRARELAGEAGRWHGAGAGARSGMRSAARSPSKYFRTAWRCACRMRAVSICAIAMDSRCSRDTYDGAGATAALHRLPQTADFVSNVSAVQRFGAAQGSEESGRGSGHRYVEDCVHRGRGDGGRHAGGDRRGHASIIRHEKRHGGEHRCHGGRNPTGARRRN